MISKKTLKLILLLVFILSCTKTQDSPDIVVDIKVSRDGYSPEKIEVPKGKVVLFRITSADEGLGENETLRYYGHCFYIMPPYDVMVENIKKGETKEIKIKMLYPGSHIITCPYCSDYFPMKADLIVK
ncbi:MAG: cupredoxin domain-containing protein [Hydrogenothermaceae bacterium]|nr:cupredoxin domain-containing protein [Hydrogenothermaceae bacterium]